jgi:hypothetical protein
MTVGVLAGALVTGMALAPAAAKPKPDKPGSQAKVKGTTSLMFTKSVKNKLSNDGIAVTAVDPGKKKNKVKFTFPATQSEPQFIMHTGGLTFTRDGKSLTITDFKFDLSAKNVDVTVPNVGPVEDALDLSKLKITKKTVTARLKVAADKAAVLNGALETTLFTDGMFLAKTSTKF